MNASYFDGLTSRRHAVTVTLVEQRWLVNGETVSRSEHVDSVLVSSALGSTPRFVRFADGAVCEVDDTAGLAAMLASGNVADDRIGGSILNTKLVAAILVLFIALLLVTYRFGVPAAANAVADRAPEAAVKRLGATTLSTLDSIAFSPTRVDVSRRSLLISEFAGLRLPGDRSGRRSVLLFRKSDAIGANAMTLPNGTIVVTDGLISLAKNDQEILAVLAHEAGHARHRHALRMMLESSALSALLSWYVGDVNTLAVTAPASLLNAKYSRDFERDADEYAIEVMRLNDISPALLADILERMSETRGAKQGPAYLSTHPATSERLAQFRR
jgi:Zn-dependent protease with chaperone function